MGGGAERVVGRVAALGRAVVKSTAGEPLTAARFDARGLEHDRRWAVYTADGGIASGKTTRRFRRLPGLLHWRSSLPIGAAAPVLVAPDGTRHTVGRGADAALSAAFGQPLRVLPETDVPHHDDSGVHLVTTASLAAAARLAGGPIDPQRLRATVLVDTGDDDGFVEDRWAGTLAIGPEVVLRLGPPMLRCVMVDATQAGVAAEPRLLLPLGRGHDTALGLQAEVLRAGAVRVGEAVVLLPTAQTAGT